ncbi:MAG: hypothetical protein ACQESF_05160 [Nanobdellota archaeon]
MAENQDQKAQNLNQPPTDRILAMRKQNLSNNEIIQSLQKEGYNSNIILDGMNQADLKTKVEDHNSYNKGNPEDIQNKMQFQPPGEENNQRTQQNSLKESSQETYNNNNQSQMNTPPQQESQNTENYEETDKSQNTQEGMPPPMDKLSENSSGTTSLEGADQVTIERIEEIAEAIIDEKWNEIVKSINKIIDWKERTESQINKLEQRFEDLKGEFDNLNKGVLGKIGEYDKNLGNLGVEIKAMERVFQKIIPTMTENVHALQKLTEKLTEKTEEK